MSAMPRVRELRFKVVFKQVDAKAMRQMQACISCINDSDFFVSEWRFRRGTCRLDLLVMAGRRVEAEITYCPTGFADDSYDEILTYADFSVLQEAAHDESVHGFASGQVA